MNWGNQNHKPGRPAAKHVSKPFTETELTVYKNGFAALAAAVYKQWVRDGSPHESEEAAMIWKKVAEELNR